MQLTLGCLILCLTEDEILFIDGFCFNKSWWSKCWCNQASDLACFCIILASAVQVFLPLCTVLNEMSCGSSQTAGLAQCPTFPPRLSHVSVLPWAPQAISWRAGYPLELPADEPSHPWTLLLPTTPALLAISLFWKACHITSFVQVVWNQCRGFPWHRQWTCFCFFPLPDTKVCPLHLDGAVTKCQYLASWGWEWWMIRIMSPSCRTEGNKEWDYSLSKSKYK